VAATYRAAAAAEVAPVGVVVCPSIGFGLNVARWAAMSAAKKAIIVFFFSVISFSSNVHSYWPPVVAKDLLLRTPITKARSGLIKFLECDMVSKNYSLKFEN
jgi:hypothetical protein